MHVMCHTTRHTDYVDVLQRRSTPRLSTRFFAGLHLCGNPEPKESVEPDDMLHILRGRVRL